MAFILSFTQHSHCVFDSSAVVDGCITERLEALMQEVPDIAQKKCQLGKESHDLQQYDRPFIILPPGWAELRDALKVISKVDSGDSRWVTKIEKTLNVLEKLVTPNIVNGEEWDDPKYGDTRGDRKLAWLEKIEQLLKGDGKKIVFITEDPMLKIRASIAGFSTYSAMDYLTTNVENLTLEAWNLEAHIKGNAFIVDEKFLTSDLGCSLASKLCFPHPSDNTSSKLFFTREMQKFAHVNQLDDVDRYPFSYRDPLTVKPNGYPVKAKECVVPDNYRRMNELELERSSLLRNAMELRELYDSSIIGEPFDAPVCDGILLNQIPEAAQIYIIASDQVWAESIRQRVCDSRPNSEPEVFTMEYAERAFRYGGIRVNEGDECHLALPPWDAPVSTGYSYEDDASENQSRKKPKWDPELMSTEYMSTADAVIGGELDESD